MNLVVGLVAALLNLWPFSRPVPDDHVVARVRTPRGDEVVVTAARLRAYAAGREGADPRRLVQDLVDFELLAAEAAARGLADEAPRDDDARAVLVRRYLRREFEPEEGAAAIPKALLRQAYERNIFFFQREEGRDGDHIIVTTAENTRPSDAALDARARALAERIRADLAASPPADDQAFLAAAARYEVEAKAAGLVVRGEALGGFPRDGRYVPEFTAQAFALTEPGSLSPAFATTFGHHVFRLQEVLPARTTTFEQAEPQLRERTLPDFRLEALRGLTDRLAREVEVVIDFRPIEELQSRRQMQEDEATP